MESTWTPVSLLRSILNSDILGIFEFVWVKDGEIGTKIVKFDILCLQRQNVQKAHKC